MTSICRTDVRRYTRQRGSERRTYVRIALLLLRGDSFARTYARTFDVIRDAPCAACASIVCAVDVCSSPATVMPRETRHPVDRRLALAEPQRHGIRSMLTSPPLVCSVSELRSPFLSVLHCQFVSAAFPVRLSASAHCTRIHSPHRLSAPPSSRPVIETASALCLRVCLPSVVTLAHVITTPYHSSSVAKPGWCSLSYTQVGSPGTRVFCSVRRLLSASSARQHRDDYYLRYHATVRIDGRSRECADGRQSLWVTLMPVTRTPVIMSTARGLRH